MWKILVIQTCFRAKLLKNHNCFLPTNKPRKMVRKKPPVVNCFSEFLRYHFLPNHSYQRPRSKRLPVFLSMPPLPVKWIVWKALKKTLLLAAGFQLVRDIKIKLVDKSKIRLFGGFFLSTL